MTIHERVYHAVAEARAERWGYTETLDPQTLADFIDEQARDVNLIADVDAAILAWARFDR